MLTYETAIAKDLNFIWWDSFKNSSLIFVKFLFNSDSKCQKKAWHAHHQEECIFLKKISKSNISDSNDLFDFIRNMLRLVFKLKKGGDEEFVELPNGQKRYFADLMSHQEQFAKDETAMELVELFYEILKSCIPIKRCLMYNLMLVFESI